MTGHGLRMEESAGNNKSFTEQAKDKASEFKESARETWKDLRGDAKTDTFADKTEKTKESTKEGVDSAADKIQEISEKSGLILIQFRVHAQRRR